MPARRASGHTAVRIAAILTAAMGVINVLSGITPSMADRLRLLAKYSPLEVRNGGHLASVLAGFALLLLAVGLMRRKRVAWLLTLVVLVLSAITHLAKGLDYEEASLAAAICLPLLLWRPQFHARSDQPSVRQALETLAAASVFTLAYGSAGFYLLDKHFGVHFGLLPAIRQTLIMFTQYVDPGLEPTTGFGRYFADSIYTVAAITTGYGLLLLLRPVLAPRRASEQDRARAGAIVAAHGRTALAPFALLDDKLYFFGAGDSLLSYVVKGRVALVLGDPIGPVDQVEQSIQEFADACLKNDWIPAFYQVRPEHLPAYRRGGFQAIQIGQEATIDVQTFSLEGGERKSIRTAVNKMRRLGYFAEIAEPPHAPDLLQELNEVSDEWLSDRTSSEMRFSVGWFDLPYLNRCPLLLVRDPAHRIDAFTNIVLEADSREVTADMMRHRSAAEKGIMDFLFASLLEWAKEKGYTSFSFGLSGLSGVGTADDDPSLERALKFAYDHLNQVYDFKGLHAYKAKFGPRWSPRFLIYPSVTNLPAIAAAFIRANTGDDVLAGYLFHPR